MPNLVAGGFSISRILDHHMLFLALLYILATLTPVAVNAYCWEPGKNPEFTGPPKVEQIDIRTVRVSWFGLVKMRECADEFLVKYWQRNDPQVKLIADHKNCFSGCLYFVHRKLFFAQDFKCINVPLILGLGVVEPAAK